MEKMEQSDLTNCVSGSLAGLVLSSSDLLTGDLVSQSVCRKSCAFCTHHQSYFLTELDEMKCYRQEQFLQTIW